MLMFYSFKLTKIPTYEFKYYQTGSNTKNKIM